MADGLFGRGKSKRKRNKNQATEMEEVVVTGAIKRERVAVLSMNVS